MSLSDDTAAAVAKLQKKQGSRARWTQIGGLVLAGIVVLRVAGLFFQPPELKACDDNDVQQTLTGVLDKGLAGEHTAFRVQSLTNAQTVSRSDSQAVCTATLTMSDASKGVVHYHLTPKRVIFDNVSDR